MIDSNNVQQELSLGQRLRQITNKVRADAEAQAFIDILMNAANNGEDMVVFPDLRVVLPIMSKSDTIFDWIRSQDLQITGQVNPNNACWEYTIFW